MISLDTNVLVRYYVAPGEDTEAAKQQPLAIATLSSGKVLFVPRSVMLELEWVLRGRYQLTAEEVASALEHLLGLSNVMVEDSPMMQAAIASYRQGLDFADALHLAASSNCTELVTFDRDFAKRATRRGLAPPVSRPAA